MTVITALILITSKKLKLGEKGHHARPCGILTDCLVIEYMWSQLYIKTFHKTKLQWKKKCSQQQWVKGYIPYTLIMQVTYSLVSDPSVKLIVTHSQMLQNLGLQLVVLTPTCPVQRSNTLHICKWSMPLQHFWLSNIFAFIQNTSIYKYIHIKDNPNFF